MQTDSVEQEQKNRKPHIHIHTLIPEQLDIHQREWLMDVAKKQHKRA